MKRLWTVGAVLLGAAAAVFLAVRMEDARVVVPGNQPVSIDQVRQRLEADGWTNVQVLPKGRFLRAVGLRDGQQKTIDVEASTGRLRITDDDDPVNDDDN
jgi:hypothetical protein